jgi:hypothetical protein
MTDESRRAGIGTTISLLVSLAIVAAAVTTIWLGMRAVMDVGGFCAEGGPFVIETPCPKGVPGLLTGGFFFGAFAVLWYGLTASRHPAPSLLGLMWPALFLSLGWNFLAYGFDPPVDGGFAWGWLVPGVLFVLMGAIPLFWVIPMLFQGPRPRPLNRLGFTVAEAVGAASEAARRRPTPPGPSEPDSNQSSGLVEDLERLARLHRRRSISDEEYEQAKARLLEGR